MKVLMKKTGDTEARLTINVVEDDYKAKVDADLKEIGRKHTLPGFRKGHVPFAELKRRFGRQVTSDVINDVVYKAVVEYLKNNNIDILGEPLPVEVKELDLKNNKDFTFEYDLILTPALNVKVDKSIEIPYYTIKVSDEMINDEDSRLRRRFGKQEPGETTEPSALIKGVMMQLNEDGTINENEGAIQVLNAIVGPEFFKSKEEAEKFADKKVGDKVVFNPWKSCEGNETELASMLNIDKEIAKDVHNDFEFAISEIIVVRPAELNEEFFTNVFGPDKVHNEEEYRKALAAGIARQLSGNSEMLFRRDAQNALLAKYGDMKFADALLKKWLLARNEGLNAETIDNEYEAMLPGLKWQLISDRIAQQADIKINEEDLLAAAKFAAAEQFAQYGMTNLGDDIIEDYAKRMLQDKNYARRFAEQAGDAKLFEAIKQNVKLDNKEVSIEEFRDLVK